MRLRNSVFLLVLVLAAAAAPALAFDRTYEATFPLRAGGSFELANVNGSVDVQGWERNEVHIRAVTRSKTQPADEERVKIDVQTAPDAVSVRTRYPQEDGLDVTVEYRVRVPARGLRARIETVNGDVRVRGVEGAGELRSVNGDLVLLDGAGRFSARTTNGNIRLELARLGEGAEPARVETVNGSVVLELPASADASLDVLSLNGDFQSELPVVVEAVDARREARVRLGRGGPKITLRTVNGGIRIITPRATV
jgi:hypothetical protein